jgi:hypothetical protein
MRRVDVFETNRNRCCSSRQRMTKRPQRAYSRLKIACYSG